MQNNLIRVEDRSFEEDEVDVYRLINIFFKNIKLFILISFIGLVVTCLYIGKRIIFNKNKKIFFPYRLLYLYLKTSNFFLNI